MSKGKKSKILTLIGHRLINFSGFLTAARLKNVPGVLVSAAAVGASLLNRNESQDLCVGSAGSFYRVTSIFISQDGSGSSCEALPIKILTFTFL